MRPVRIHTFKSVTDAYLVKTRLEAAGLPAHVTGDQIANMLSGFGPAVVKVDLFVDEADQEAANRVVQEFIESGHPHFKHWHDDATADWTCRDCRETNPGTFAECWQCGRPRPAETALNADAPQPPATNPSGSRNSLPGKKETLAEVRAQLQSSPWSPPTQTNLPSAAETHSIDQADAEVRNISDRLFRAAVLGLLVPFPIGLYACWLCLNYWSERGTGWRRIGVPLMSLAGGLFGIASLWAIFYELARALQ